jgi:phosphate transport system permease protein
VLTERPEDDPSPDQPRTLSPVRSRPDRAFRALLAACAVIVLAMIAAIALKLCLDARPALLYSGHRFLTSDRWNPKSLHPTYGILGVLMGSLLVAVVALVPALAVSVATALLINEYAPVWMRGALTALVDLLAALPSVIFGLWGLRLLSTEVDGLSRWLSHHADFIPIFQVPQGNYGNSIFVCSLVVAAMIVPVIASIGREVMAQVPRDQCEAALALGGTRWGMVTDVILPFARRGIVAAALLGLGRAMAETIAVALILAGNNTLWRQILAPGGGTISALIAQQFTGLPARGQSALILAGLTLFAATLLVNLAARALVVRRVTPVGR